jgi:hypothetical protein
MTSDTKVNDRLQEIISPNQWSDEKWYYEINVELKTADDLQVVSVIPPERLRWLVLVVHDNKLLNEFLPKVTQMLYLRGIKITWKNCMGNYNNVYNILNKLEFLTKLEFDNKGVAMKSKY